MIHQENDKLIKECEIKAKLKSSKKQVDILIILLPKQLKFNWAFFQIQKNIRNICTVQLKINFIFYFYLTIDQTSILYIIILSNDFFFLFIKLILMQQVHQNSVYFWGLFNDKEFLTPTKVKELEGKGIIDVASGGYFYLALSSKGEVYGWGTPKYNRFGIQGNQNLLIPKMIPLKFQVTKIAAGNWHSLLIEKAGKIFASGHNKQGACGTGNFQKVDSYTELKIDFTPLSISCGDCFSLVISTQHDVYSCGHSDLHGHKKSEHLHTLKRLDFSGEKIKAIATGFTHALAVSVKGATYSWGKGEFNQLGHGNKNDVKQPKLIKKLADVKINQISCTRGQKNCHSMAVGENGQLYTWGAGYKGKLGHQSYWSHQNSADEPQPRQVTSVTSKIIKSSAGGIHSNILNDNGEVLSFGCGSDGRLGHSQSKEYVYLYRQGFPKVIETLKPVFVTNVQSSYYHNICIGYKR